MTKIHQYYDLPLVIYSHTDDTIVYKFQSM